MSTVFLSLGSNIGNRQEHLNKAVNEIINRIGEVKTSMIYETSAWGFVSDNFLNQVVSAETNLSPLSLIAVCLDIEKSLGRVRENATGYSSRVIDIDILFYDSLIIESENLIIPHPLIQERRFILTPLQEIASELLHPVLQKTISQLLSECPDDGTVRVFPGS